MVYHILVLHGFAQNIDIIRHQTGALRNKLKNSVLFHYLNAPHELCTIQSTTPRQHTLIQQGIETNDRYSWWYSGHDGSLNHYNGFNESFQLIRSAWNSCAVEYQCDGFDGIMGFSQGACLVTILAAIKHSYQNNTLYQSINNTQYSSTLVDVDFLHSLKFCIIVSGFITHDVDLQKIYGSHNNPCHLPSLHVIGESDAQIEPSRSYACTECFVSPTIISHSGGHYIPLKKEYLDQYVQFITQHTQSSSQTTFNNNHKVITNKL